MKVKVKSLSHVRLLATPWTEPYQAPLSRWIKTCLLSIFPLCSSRHFVDGSPHGFRTGATAPDIKHRRENTKRRKGTSPHVSSSTRETTVPRRPPKTSRWSRLHHVPIPNQSRDWRWPALALFFCSVAKLCLTLRPHGLQHARLPCPLSPGDCSNSCPLSWWCYPTISPTVALFCSCLQSFPASGSFLMNQLFTTGGQSIGVLASASVLPMNIQDWLPLELTGLISSQFKELSRVFSSTTVQKHQFSGSQPALWSNSHICTWLLERP